MTKILMLCGSTREDGATRSFLNKLKERFTHLDFNYFEIGTLPLFHPEDDSNPLPESVVKFRETISRSDTILIASPEYLYNIPAVLKSALEWCSSSGNLYAKKVLPVLYTPMAPRGEQGMQSLLFSLAALKANVLASLILHHQDFLNEDPSVMEILDESMNLLEKS